MCKEVKAYRKAKTHEERQNISERLVGAELANFAMQQKIKTPIQLREMIRETNRKCERLAALYKEYEPGWKLHRDWFKMIFSQLAPHQNTAILFEHYGWQYTDSLMPKFDTATKYHAVQYYEEDTGETKELRILLESIGKVPYGSKWKSTTGKVWEVTIVEGDTVYMETEDKNGNYIDAAYPVNEVLKWSRVYE